MYVCTFVVKIGFENVNSIKYSVNVLPVHTAMTVVFFVDIPILLAQSLSKKAIEGRIETFIEKYEMLETITSWKITRIGTFRAHWYTTVSLKPRLFCESSCLRWRVCWKPVYTVFRANVERKTINRYDEVLISTERISQRSGSAFRRVSFNNVPKIKNRYVKRCWLTALNSTECRSGSLETVSPT